MNPVDLRERTNAAIVKIKNKDREKEIKAKVSKNLKQIKYERIALNILDRLRGRAEHAADLGKRYVTIMKLVKNRDIDDYGLKGVAAIVDRKVRALGFSTTVETMHDGMGINSWDELVLEW